MARNFMLFAKALIDRLAPAIGGKGTQDEPDPETLRTCEPAHPAHNPNHRRANPTKPRHIQPTRGRLVPGPDDR